jgi:hypothetical protein
MGSFVKNLKLQKTQKITCEYDFKTQSKDPGNSFSAEQTTPISIGVFAPFFKDALYVTKDFRKLLSE